MHRTVNRLQEDLVGLIGLPQGRRAETSRWRPCQTIPYSSSRSRPRYCLLSMASTPPGPMAKLAAANPSLGRHLAATVRTGRYCSYTPDPRLPIAWQL
jgi:hypothetical protein